jgi:hypothetical protein
MASGQVFAAAEAHGFSKRQMQRAHERLGVKTEKDGMRGGWTWTLGEDAARDRKGVEDAEDSALRGSAPSGTFGGNVCGEDAIPDSKIPEDAEHRSVAPSVPSASAWRVTRADGNNFELRTVPSATLAEMQDRYPGTSVEPVSDG